MNVRVEELKKNDYTLYFFNIIKLCDKNNEHALKYAIDIKNYNNLTKVCQKKYMIDYLDESIRESRCNSLFIFGVIFENGFGAPKDLVKAVTLYKQSSTLGHVHAKINLAHICINENDKKNINIGIKLLEEASELNCGLAQSTLGQFYIEGKFVDRNYGLALSLFKKAIKNGYYYGLYHIGKMYENGCHVDCNYEEALKCYEELLKYESDAYYHIATLYHVKFRDYKKAFSNWTIGSQNDNIYSLLQLAIICLDKPLEYKFSEFYGDTKKGIELCKKIIVLDKNNEQAYYMLACTYFRKGDFNNYNEALALFEKVSKMYDSRYASLSLMNLFAMYRDGIGVIKNEKMAFLLINEAVEKDNCNTDALILLGDMYMCGIGTTQDVEMGSMYILQAGAKGNKTILDVFEKEEEKSANSFKIMQIMSNSTKSDLDDNCADN